jgi:hypothetical protein
MKPPFTPLPLILLTLALSLPNARAFPPAPAALIYGMVKDQYGTPLQDTGDTVILQTPAGVRVAGFVQPNLAIGVNYLIHVPMDAGLTAQPYTPNALTTATPYKLYVVVGSVTNLPIQMTGPNLLLGGPAQKTFQNLTLGTDTNLDGIPDQWLAEFLSEIGGNLSPASLNPNGIYTKDGRTLMQEYLLGNYPFNPSDDFSVQIVNQSAGSAVLAFTTMTGRTYTAYGSPDLQNWTPLTFTTPAAGPGPQSSYYASSIQPLQIQTVQPTNAPPMQFFRLQLQ